MAERAFTLHVWHRRSYSEVWAESRGGQPVTVATFSGPLHALRAVVYAALRRWGLV